jgi:hypothetical protein
MPGRYEALADAWHEVERTGALMIVCLAPPGEIEKKSPEYTAALEANNIPVTLRRFPVEDFQGPALRS